MIGDPTVSVTCDICGYEESHGLTALVRSSWDMRDLAQELKSDGWRLEDGLDGKVACQSCVEEETEEEE